MSSRHELAAFALVLAGLVSAFFHESLIGGKVLSPADVLFVSASFREVKGPGYEPANRLLIDPVLQFQPWLEFNRSMLRQGHLPLWNSHAGCGAPHLANGQSAVFDAFNAIAYVGELPWALAPMAAARLWFAGLGMFLLARAWGLGSWGRWFAGLTFPFTGFLVVWLLYPVTNAAVWMPWAFLAADRVFRKPGWVGVGVLGLAVGGLFLGGHIQTSAHVLLAVGLDLAWRVVASSRRGENGMLPRLAAWCGGVGLGLGVAAITIVPLAFYLGKSPVWGDRERERPSALRVTRPRVLDSLCTAVPDLYGSQRRGQPNLARALGVHNFNESAGGFAGLATLLWLVPQAWRSRRGDTRVRFLFALGAIGFLGAFGFAPVVNVLRAVPVVNVTDLRRLTLWVAFSSSLLGGLGMDGLEVAWPRAVSRWWLSLGLALAFSLGIGATLVGRLEPTLRAKAERHYVKAVGTAAGAPASEGLAIAKADRQVKLTLTHVPLVLARTAAEVLALGTLAWLAHGGLVRWSRVRLALVALTLCELFAIGYGLNPAIGVSEDRPQIALMERLRDLTRDGSRVLGLGQELLPNVAMRYGLKDPRNYDSVEAARSLEFFRPLYDPRDGVSSRGTIDWSGVLRASDRLREAAVSTVVTDSPPPASFKDRAERVGDVWVVTLDHEPMVSLDGGISAQTNQLDNGHIEIVTFSHKDARLTVRETFDPGWKARVDGVPAAVEAVDGVFIGVRVGRGERRVVLVYDPAEVRLAGVASCVSLALCFGACASGLKRNGFRNRSLGLGRPRVIGLESIS